MTDLALQSRLLDLATGGDLAPQHFSRVPVADLLDAAPPPPLYWWHGLVPGGHVSSLNAHGGVGKSMVALMMAASMVEGVPLFGIPTRRARVAYFSAEDPASVVRYRLHLICNTMGLDPAELADGLHILDATAGDPALFREVSAAGTRQGITTAAYTALGEYLATHDINVLIVDNASDTFEASEIDRARVRAFMRSLSKLAQPDRGVLLLAHVDKGTSRGDRTDTEGYSGSTAWNNSARSRMYLSRDKDGALLLQHQKHNLGPLHAPLRLCWPPGGVPMVDSPMDGIVQHIADSTDTKALLRLIHEFNERGEFVGTATTSRTHAGKLLRGQPGFPSRLKKDGEVFDLLRQAERRSLLERCEFKGKDRKPRERWELTPKGREIAGIAATAATSRDLDSSAVAQCPQEPAATAATSPPGGVGQERAHAEGPEVAA